MAQIVVRLCDADSGRRRASWRGDLGNGASDRGIAMKLYDVPRDSRIRLSDGTQLNFKRLDGMYSLCLTDDNEPVHIAAWTEVVVVGQELEALTIDVKDQSVGLFVEPPNARLKVSATTTMQEQK
jgi:hypothetical protein